MSLVWHIAKKDLRRLALPALLWLAFVGVSAAMLQGMHLREDAVRANDYFRWIDGVKAFAIWTSAMHLITCVVLAGYMMVEDPAVGTTGFWLTRPIAGWWMLAAKTLTVAILMLGAPVLALTPTWLASGFSATEWMRAAGEFAAGWSVFVAVAIIAAALTRSLGQFLPAVLAVTVGIELVQIPVFGTWRSAPPLEVSRQWLASVAPLGLMAVVAIAQFSTRRPRLGWLVLAGGLVVVGSLRAFWPWDLTPILPQMWARNWPAAERIEDREAKITVARAEGTLDSGAVVTLRVEDAGAHDGFLAVWSGEERFSENSGRTYDVVFERSERWGDGMARRIAGLEGATEPNEWVMKGKILANAARAQGASPAGAIKFWLLRLQGRVMAELPLRVGAQMRDGSSELRIVGITEDAARGGWTRIVVEERDTTFGGLPNPFDSRTAREADDSRQDRYLIVHRGAGLVLTPGVVDAGSARLNSMLVGVRQLEFNAPNGIGREWLEGAVLIKVRFETVGRFTRSVTMPPVKLGAEEDKK